MAKAKVSTASAVVDDLVLPPEVEASDPAEGGTNILEPPQSKMSTEALDTLRKRIKDLRTQIEDGYWDLALDLQKVWKDTLYIEWGFENWADYVEKELDFKLRTAQYMVGIADWFGKMTPDVQTWVKSLGWTKAKELVGKVDESNWSGWKKKIAGKSVYAIIDMMKSDKDAKAGKDTPTEEFKRRGFKLAPLQLENVEKAVGKAKEDAKTDSDGHAIDLICTEYLASHQGIEGLNDYLSKIEKTFGVSLVAYNKTADEVVYGQELLESLGSD